MRPSFALRTLSLPICLSAFSPSGHAAIQFNCSDSLTREVADALVLRCSGVLDVRGDSAGDPNDVLSHAGAVRLHGEQGLSLDNLALAAHTIELTSEQRVVLGNGLVVRALGDVFVGVPPRAQVGQGGTRQDAILNPIAGGAVTIDGSRSGNLVLSAAFMVPAYGTRQPGGSVVVGGGSISGAFFGPIDALGIIDVTNSGVNVSPGNGRYTVPFLTGQTTGSVTSPVPEPGAWVLALVGLGALSLTLRRRG